jgi:hypothetical protein
VLILLPRVFAQPRPKADMSLVEIPQRSSLLPSSAVLSFGVEAREVGGASSIQNIEPFCAISMACVVYPALTAPQAHNGF